MLFVFFKTRRVGPWGRLVRSLVLLALLGGGQRALEMRRLVVDVVALAERRGVHLVEDDVTRIDRADVLGVLRQEAGERAVVADEEVEGLGTLVATVQVPEVDVGHARAKVRLHALESEHPALGPFLGRRRCADLVFEPAELLHEVDIAQRLPDVERYVGADLDRRVTDLAQRVLDRGARPRQVAAVRAVEGDALEVGVGRGRDLVETEGRDVARLVLLAVAEEVPASEELGGREVGDGHRMLRTNEGKRLPGPLAISGFPAGRYRIVENLLFV